MIETQPVLGQDSRVVIVGAGHAGGSVAAFLRQFGHRGPITLVGDQLYAPYQRPPLSKAYLKGGTDAEALKLKADAFYAAQDITLRLGSAVASIEPEKQRVLLKGGGHEAYDCLILATGSTARALPLAGADAPNVHMLRSVADADALRAAMGPGRRLAIIGGGYVGLEVAASARALGADAVIVEREARLLARTACEPLSRFFSDYHAARGVEIVCGAAVDALEHDTNGMVSRLILADGRRIECDFVLVGIGASPCDELAATAGLACDGGVLVDIQGRTSDPRIFAVGDMTRRPMPLYGGVMVRLESVPNALEQSRQVAHAILGRASPANEVPWFWSDQYDLKLQIAGITMGSEEILIRGSVASARFAIFHMNGDRVRAVEAVNAVPEFMVGRQLIASGLAVSRARLLNPALTMKQIVEDQREEV